MKRLEHNISPVAEAESRVLILGSFPSEKSREAGFYYANPQNRFWKTISALFDEKIPDTEEKKRELLMKHKIALWDVIRECEIKGSSDSSIKNATVNDIPSLLEKTKIEVIFLNGKASASLFEKYFGNKINIKSFIMPSTSPANASFSLDRLIHSWSKLKDWTY